MSYGKGHYVCYSMTIQSLANRALSALQTTWERDLNLTLDDEECYKICKNIKTMSRDTRAHPVQFKIGSTELPPDCLDLG